MEHFSFEPIFANSVSLVAIQLPMLRPLKEEASPYNEGKKKEQDHIQDQKEVFI